MRTEIARTVSTVAIWAAVAYVLDMAIARRPFNGTPEATIVIFLGTAAFLSIGAAIGTLAVWRSPRPSESPKDVHREL
jgi:hypothetical protein